MSIILKRHFVKVSNLEYVYICANQINPTTASLTAESSFKTIKQPAKGIPVPQIIEDDYDKIFSLTVSCLQASDANGMGTVRCYWTFISEFSQTGIL
jgi:hypothetical protein